MSSSKLLTAGLLAGAALVGGVLYLLTRPAPVKAAAGEKKKATKLSLEDTIKVFEKITQMMQVVVVNLADHEQKLRAAAAQRGKAITETEMEQYLMGQFRKTMAEVEQAVYQEFNTTEEEVKLASSFYEDNAEFQKTLERLRTLFKAVTGAPQNEMVELPEHVTMEKTLDIMAEILESINEAVETIYEELQGKGLHPQSQEFQMELQNKYMEDVGALRKKVHEKHEVNEEILHSAVVKFQTEPVFKEKLMELSNAHRERLDKAGFKTA